MHDFPWIICHVQCFRLFDKDKTGKTTFTNLKAVARELGESFSDQVRVSLLIYLYCFVISCVANTGYDNGGGCGWRRDGVSG